MKILRKFFYCSIVILLWGQSANAIGVKSQYDITVAADGSGTFKTVQEAINAVPDFRKVTTTIFIKKGIYKEKLNLSASKKLVKIIGESNTETILTFDDWAQKKMPLEKKKVLQVLLAFMYMVMVLLQKILHFKILQVLLDKR